MLNCDVVHIAAGPRILGGPAAGKLSQVVLQPTVGQLCLLQAYHTFVVQRQQVLLCQRVCINGLAAPEDAQFGPPSSNLALELVWFRFLSHDETHTSYA